MTKKKNFFKQANNFSLTLLNSLDVDTFLGVTQAYRGMALSHDGNYIMLCSYGGLERFDRIDMTTPYDVSTASTKPSYVKWNSTPIGVCFNNDGTKGYNFALGTTLYEKTLTGVYAMSPNSGGVTQAISVSQAANYHRTMQFNDDGSRLYVCSTNNVVENTGVIVECNFSTPYDITTYTGQNVLGGWYSLTAPDVIKGFTFYNSGNNLIVADTSGTVRFFELSTAYDISTHGGQIGTFDVSGDITSFNMMFGGGNQLYLYIHDAFDNYIHQYQIN